MNTPTPHPPPIEKKKGGSWGLGRDWEGEGLGRGWEGGEGGVLSLVKLDSFRLPARIEKVICLL